MATITVFISTAIIVQPLFGLGIAILDFNYTIFNGLMMYKPWRLYLLATSLLPAICCLVITFLPESPKFLLSIGRKTEAIQVLEKVHKINNKSSVRNILL